MTRQHIFISDIVTDTGELFHVVDHALRTRGPKPVERIGIMRVWTIDQLPAIRKSIAASKARQRQVVQSG